LHNSGSDDGDKVPAETLALSALVWILQDQTRAERFMSLTGLTADDLRERLSDRTVQAAVLEFLVNHEPDLLAAAKALETEPVVFIAAHQALSA
jgi:hypothetical protein